jgi:hypothetical protein
MITNFNEGMKMLICSVSEENNMAMEQYNHKILRNMI